MAEFMSLVFGAGVTASLHPISYAKVLIQIGHEPLPPYQTTTLFGRSVLCYPNVFQYGGLIGQGVSNATQNYLNATFPSPGDNEVVPEDQEILNVLKRYLKESGKETVARCFGVIVSHPLHVVMMRHMAEFVGRDAKYTNPWSSAVEVHSEGGWRGFFTGLLPRLLGEVLSIWLSNLLATLVLSFAVPADKQNKDTRQYTQAVSSLLVSQLTYPFGLVANVMCVNNCGLVAGLPPHMPAFDSWRDCWQYLSETRNLKRGSSMFWRYYTGATVISAGGHLKPQPFHL